MDVLSSLPHNPLKNMSSSIGMMTIPTEWKNKTCSKPPTSITDRCRTSELWVFKRTDVRDVSMMTVIKRMEIWLRQML